MSVHLPPPVAGLEPTLPSTWYRSDAIFALEKERIFCREWLCVARAEELSEPGAYRVLDLLGESLLLVRNRERQLRAFYNVCRHRGSRLCRESAAVHGGTPALLGGGIGAGRITCPYHQWSYDLDGRLIGAPYLSTEPGFDKTLFSLYPVALECWGGFVFLNLTPAKAAPLAGQLGAVPVRLARYPLSELRIGHAIDYDVAANWKVISRTTTSATTAPASIRSCVPSCRRSRRRVAGSSIGQRGIPHRDGAYTFTRSGTTTRTAFPGLNDDERVRHKGELIYPNLFLSLARPCRRLHALAA